MGGNNSSNRHEWQPPSEPMASISTVPVVYHLAASQVTLEHNAEAGCCFSKLHVTMEYEELYSMLAEQYSKGYRMLYFTRIPGNMNMDRQRLVVKINFGGFFHVNPSMIDSLCNEGPVSWKLHVDRTWLQTKSKLSGGITYLNQTCELDTSLLVDAIARNTQNGERLIAATVTGHAEDSSFGSRPAKLGPNKAMDLFFEVPSPVPRENYAYNIALVPVHVEFDYRGPLFFPKIEYDWMSTLNHHLNQGWHLVDIYIDIPTVEQLRTPRNRLRYICSPMDTTFLWIFERPVSRMQDPTPLYEGTIMEQSVSVGMAETGCGVRSTHDWMSVISDMGSRGWELSCFLECHDVKSRRCSATIKTLLFFQRPLT